MYHHTQTVGFARMWHRLRLTGIRSLKLPGPGAVAHMSLHQKPTMSKSHRTEEADNHRSPIFRPGDLVSVYVGDRAVGPFEAAFPSGDRASKGGL